MRRILATCVLATLAVTACSGGGAGSANSSTAGNEVRSYDVSGVAKVDEIAALLPAEVAASGKLTIGASTDYAPAEFRGEDLTTPIGYDVDLGKAIGKVLGLEAEVIDGEFASLIPGIGSTYNIGISSFTIRPDRIEQANMIAYISVGSSYAVPTGNPDGFNPDDVCGTTIAVQIGTWQEEELTTFNADCQAAGQEPITVLPYTRQSEATTNVVGKKADAFYADSTVADYATALTNGQLEVVGGIRDASPQGIVVAKDDPALTEAVQRAMQHLMDDGTWAKILDSWGINAEAALTTAELNPTS